MSSVTDKYNKADTEVIFNENDPDLTPIHYKLPHQPAPSSITGYGLDRKDQKWQREEMPLKLKELDEDSSMTPSDKVSHLEANQAYYKQEIDYIQQDIEKCSEGTWAYIKGKPYWIPPAGYYWLQWYKIEGKPVQYRRRDHKFWIFDYMVDNDPNCVGFNFPKHRREGATNRASCKQFKVAATTPYAHCGMQSKDRDHAAEIHETMILGAWRNDIPFWHKPIYNGHNTDSSVLRFSSPVARSNPDFGKKALNSLIDYRDSGLKAYDGLKLKRIFNDEIGKTVECDVKRRFEIQRQCVSEGSTIIGKFFNGSTVDEMDKGGGRNFKALCDQSHYERRNATTGRTTSWLYNFFMPAGEGYDGEIPVHLQKKYGSKRWIDEYGFDVIDPETGKPAAEAFHLAVRANYKRDDDIEGEIEYTRQFPLNWKDCWRRSVRDCNFNLAIIEDRLDYFRNGNTEKQRGNFSWVDNIVDGSVMWTPDPAGRWYLSYQFPDPRSANKSFMQDGMKLPGNTRNFIAGGDPFKFKITKSGKRSNGGGAVFMKHNIVLDPPEKDIGDWVTNRFCCTYSFRPKDKKLYGEDMIMMCVYFGCEMNPEINVEFLWDYFMDRGYSMYLHHDINPLTNKVNIQPGSSTSEKYKERIFREYQYYIQNHGHREVHDELLEECKEIEDDMGDFDLFVAGGYALIGATIESFKVQEQVTFDIDQLFPTYTYGAN